MHQDVAEKYAQYPAEVRPKIESLRQLIVEVAANLPEVGVLEETLKWGEPAFLTAETGSGATIRIDWKPKQPEQYGLYVNCQTSLIESFKTLFPDLFRYDGQRAILFELDAPLPADELRVCIAMALTYHLK